MAQVGPHNARTVDPRVELAVWLDEEAWLEESVEEAVTALRLGPGPITFDMEGVLLNPRLNLVSNLTDTGSYQARQVSDVRNFFEDLDPVIEALAPGESTLIAVGSDMDGVLNHAVALGKTQEGRVYLYDPGSPIGDLGHVAFLDPDLTDFWAHLSNRAVEISTGEDDAQFGYMVAGGIAFRAE